MAQTVKCLSTMRETRVQSLGREDLLVKEMATHSGILPGKSHERRSLVGYNPWGHEESDTAEQLSFPFLCTPLFHLHQEALEYLFPFCLNCGVGCISKVIDISPSHLDSSLCFIQPDISHDILCI